MGFNASNELQLQINFVINVKKRSLRGDVSRMYLVELCFMIVDCKLDSKHAYKIFQI